MYRRLKTSFPIILGVALVAFFFTFRGEAQQPRPQAAAASKTVKPISRQAVVFATTEAVRDLPNREEMGPDARNEREPVEKNPDNISLHNFYRARIAAQGSTRKEIPSFDAALAGYQGPSPNPPSGPLASFDGMTANDGITTTGSIVAPSDQNVAVGPKDVVQATNTGFRIWDKAGNPRIPAKALSALFARLGGVCANFDAGDPIVQYDRSANRWVISQFNFANSQQAPFYQCFAVSQTSDPTGAYYAYGYETPVGPINDQNFPDYPKVGTWIDGYYMSVNQFDRSKPSGQQFNGTGFYAFDRTKMLAGDPTASFIYFNFNLSANPEGVASVQPADIDGFSQPNAGQPCPFVYHLSDEYESPPFNIDALRMFDFKADFANPANSTFTERPDSRLLLAPFDARFPQFETGTAAEAEQPPPATLADSLNVLGYRVMYRLQYRRLGNNENLTGVFMVNTSGVDPNNAPLYQGGLRYFQIRKTTAAGAYTVFDQGTFSPDAGNGATGMNRFMGSAAIDHQGNLAVSYTTSSTTKFPSVTYAGRDFNAAGIPNANLSNETDLFVGTGVQIGTSNRWGDYQSLVVDPVDDCTFWTTNQYYNTTNVAFNWRTRIGSFKFPSCVAPNQGTVSGRITSCETGAPIAGAVIHFANAAFPSGHSTTSNPDGTYTIQLPSGGVQTLTNYQATVSHPSRGCSSAGPTTVGVAKDGNTPHDVCLNGTANPVLDKLDPNAVVINGGDGDGQFDPNECNTMNVRLTNTGCATAKNLKGTLTSNTPGVTISAPGTVPYPEIVIDGKGFNSVPFQITTSSAVQCGPIEFTLTTMFNGGSTTSNFTVQSACGTGPNQTVMGSVDPTDPKTVNGRLGRSDPPTSCAAPQGCPGGLGTGPRSYDAIPFVNGPGEACITVNPQPNGNNAILAGAYIGAFDPNNLCTNYAGDQGLTMAPFSFIVPANATFNVVIMEANAGTPPTPYTITVSGISAPAQQGSGPCTNSITTQVQDPEVSLGDTVNDTVVLNTGGNPTGTITFRLYGPNDNTCTGTAVFTSVVTVNGDGSYTSGSFTPSVAGTYRWVATYSGDGNNAAAANACNDPNETVVVNPEPPAAEPQNLASRALVGTGDRVMIGGFIITGNANAEVLIRGLGPSLSEAGLSNTLQNPRLDLYNEFGQLLFANQDWKDTQETQIRATGIPPTFNLESAMVATLPPGNYTAVLQGVNGGTGIGLIEIYDISATGVDAQLGNLSTRAFVGTGQEVLIGGFILGESEGDAEIVVRAIGPSLTARGVSGALADPFLELRDSNGLLIQGNDNWNDVPAQATELTAKGFAPSNNSESAIIATLPPGTYTAIVRGVNATTGVGLVEIFHNE